MTADLWAGAEVQVATTLSYLAERPGLDVRAVLFNDGRLASELRQRRIEVDIVEEAHHNSVDIVFTLSRLLAEHRIDLVHTHRYKDTVLGAIAAKLAGVPRLVRTMHGLREPMSGWNRIKFGAYEALDNLAMRWWANRVIAVSHRMAGALIADGFKSPLVTTIHNGIDLRSIVPAKTAAELRRELGVDESAVVIGTAGRLAPVKGQDTFLRAARLVLDVEPRARFVIAGDGPLERELGDLAAQLGVADACRFVGARHDIHDVVSAMDVFVLPSLNEGLPMAVLEAMALGRPVVVSKVGGLPEVVRHRSSGLLVEPGNPRQLADACLDIARDPQLAGRIGAEAKRVVHQEFSSERSGEALVGVYRAVARQAQRSPAAAVFARRVMQYGVRKIRLALERRQVNRLRRSPAAVIDALKAGKQILVVCHGNIIRSPFAAFLLEQSLGHQPRVSIASAGLEAMTGRPPHPTALRKAAERRIDLSTHAASRIERNVVGRSDVIFVMDIPQLLVVRQRFPEARAKTFLLTSLAPETPLEIRDPVDGDETVFHACFDHITRAVRPLAGVLAQSPQRT